MATVERRMEELEKVWGDAACLCSKEIAFVIVEPGWDKEQIREAEASKHIDCPTHGRTKPFILHLSPSDVDG